MNVGGEVKFPAATVLFTGDRLAATSYLSERAPGRVVIGGTATAGDHGTATAGDFGTATAGKYGNATAGLGGTAKAGDFGTATAGLIGTATAGDGGTIIIRWHDHDHDRDRLAVGYVGENGIVAGTAYRCDKVGGFVRAAL